MRILTIGDIHAKASNVKEVNELTSRIVKVIKEQAPDVTVILGDLHDTFEKIHTQALNTIDYFFKEITSCWMHDVYYVVGNHCAINNSIFLEEDHAFNVFKNKYDNLIIVDKIEILEKDRLKFVFCPYTPPGRFIEALNGAEAGATAIFAHQEFFNASIAGFTSQIGDKWPSNNPLVISGHIHERSRPQSNIIYVGTPWHTTFAELDEKSISIFEFSEDGYKEDLFYLNMPRKLTVYLNASELLDYVIPENCSLRIMVTDTYEEISKLQKTKKYKDLCILAKVITKITDKVAVKKNKDGQNYLSILSKSIESESEVVKNLFQEAINETSVKECQTA